MARTPIAVLISGRGSNLQSLIDACAAPDYPAEIVLVISNRPDAKGLERATKADIPIQIIDHKTFAGRPEFEADLHDALKNCGAKIVCLAGFMRILNADFVNRWKGRLLNIHPSLLPAFKGLHVHERAIAAGVKLAGCTVHFVSAEMDAGPIIGQAAVPVAADDDADALAARILAVEHQLYPTCLKLIANGEARLAGSVVRFEKNHVSPDAIVNPAK